MATRKKGLGAAAAAGDAAVAVVDSFRGTGSSVTVPAHSVGNMILITLGAESLTPPATPAGYTSVTTGSRQQPFAPSFNRAFRLVFKISTTGASENVATSSYADGLILKNGTGVSVVAVKVESGFGTGTPTFPALSGLTPNAGYLLIGGNYGFSDADVIDVTGPFDAFELSSSYGYKENHGLSSFAEGAYVSYSASVVRLVLAAEITND